MRTAHHCPLNLQVASPSELRVHRRQSSIDATTSLSLSLSSELSISSLPNHYSINSCSPSQAQTTPAAQSVDSLGTDSIRLVPVPMDHLLINESSFSAANLSSYSLADIWPLKEEASQCGLGPGVVSLGGSENGGRSVEASTVTEQNSAGRKRKEVTADVEEEEEDESSRMGSATVGNNSSKLSNKHGKVRRTRDKNCTPKPDVRAAARSKLSDQTTGPSEPARDYIHVRARRGQATDSHSLAERARREKISERMKILQEIVPGCSKVIGKALILDEIINYIQSLQHQVEFLSMKLEAVTSRMNMNSTVDGFHLKDLFDVSGMMFGAREYEAAPEPQWLHMQIGNNFEQPK